MKKSDLPEYLKGAYDIFVAELRDHTKELSKISEPELSKSSTINEVIRRFHTLKGGAGFLGLTEIFECSDRAEKVFKKAALDKDTDAPTESESLKKELDEALNILRAEHKKIT